MIVPILQMERQDLVVNDSLKTPKQVSDGELVWGLKCRRPF